MTPTPPDKQETRDRELVDAIFNGAWRTNWHIQNATTALHAIISNHLSLERLAHEKELLQLQANEQRMREALQLYSDIDEHLGCDCDAEVCVTISAGIKRDEALKLNPGQPLLDKLKELEEQIKKEDAIIRSWNNTCCDRDFEIKQLSAIVVEAEKVLKLTKKSAEVLKLNAKHIRFISQNPQSVEASFGYVEILALLDEHINELDDDKLNNTLSKITAYNTQKEGEGK